MQNILYNIEYYFASLHAVTSLETARSLANGPSGGGGGEWAEGEFSGNGSVSYLSLAMVALEESVGGA